MPAAALSKIEQAKAERCGLELEAELDQLAHAGWQQLDEADLTIRLKWLGIFFRPVTQGDSCCAYAYPMALLIASSLNF